MWRLGPCLPHFISTTSLPSGLVSSSPCPGLSAACLLRRRRLQSIILPSLLYKYKHNRPNTDFHLTEATVALTTSPVRRDLCLRGIDPVSSRLIHVNFCHSNTELLKILFISWWIKTEFVNKGSWNVSAFSGVDFLEAVITPLIYN